MLQAIEAIIEKNGTVHLLEPVQLSHPMRAVITFLEPLESQNNNHAVLALLRSPLFQNAPAGNAAEMETAIQANRQAWGDT